MTEGASISDLRVNDALWILDPLARRVGQKYPAIEHGELVSVGYIAIRKAAESFDDTLGVAFSSYAWTRVLGAMLDTVRRAAAVSSSVHRAGSQALALLEDRGNVLRDDEAQHRATAQEFLSAVAGAMRADVLSTHSGTHAAGEVEAALEHRGAVVRLEAALKTLPADLAQIVELHYMGATTLRSISEQLSISYRTARRRHNEALHALAMALRTAAR